MEASATRKINTGMSRKPRGENQCHMAIYTSPTHKIYTNFLLYMSIFMKHHRYATITS